jgi:hypothetical protein
MMRIRLVLLAFLLSLVFTGDAEAQSKLSSQQPPSQIKSSRLGANNGPTQPAPTVNFPTSQEIAEAIASGIERAAKNREAIYYPPPPDSSGWYFTLFTVIFTGLLVVVGGSQCYLIFWTLKATEIAANAAKDAAEHIPRIERAYLFGGPAEYGTTITDNLEQVTIVISVQNYGKTPGVLIETYGEIVSEIPKLPPDSYKIENKYRFDIVYSAGAPARVLPDHSFSGTYYLPSFFIGYVKYTTITDDATHTSYWCVTNKNISGSRYEWLIAEARGWNSYD